MCSKCGSDNIRVYEYDFGRCSQTGYHDAGERFACRDCGLDGDVDELLTDGTVPTWGHLPLRPPAAEREGHRVA
jgi:hypothetical protein